MDRSLRDQLQSTLGTAYTFERELGGGGMSRVFLAEETHLGRRVVVKVLAPELAEGLSAERFAREVRLAARLQHPNVVPVLAAGTLPAGPDGGAARQGLPYYTMPYIDGASLRERLGAGALSLGEAIAVLRDVVRALAYAHSQGVVHRDIKPENVLLTGGAAVVADFGIAKAVSAASAGATLTQLGTSIGTPAYMAPEQAAGDPNVDHRADLYAWGLVAWEALAGRHPFADRTTPMALIGAQLTRVPDPLGTVRPDLPPALAAVVARCLAKDPQERPTDAAAVLRALDAAALTPSEPLPALRSAAAPNGSRPALAVLPFASLSASADDEYLADGITEELLGALSQLGAFHVAGRASCFAFKGRASDHAEVAAKLGATVIVEGSVRRAGSRMRISASLTDAVDGRQLWSERFDRELTDIFALQDEITGAVVAALRTRLAAPVVLPPSVAARHSANAEAYQLYLRGRFFLGQRTAGMRLALECFERAVALDPSYALAQVAVAEAVALLGVYAFIAGPPSRERALAALAQADATSPGLPDALFVRAIVTLYHECRDAETVLARALTLDPGNAQAIAWAAQGDAFFGRDERARQRLAAAISADPYSALVHANAAFVSAWLGAKDDALAHARRALELDAIPFARYVHAFALLEAGEAQAALEAARGAVAVGAIRTRILPGFIAFLLAHLGRDAEARALLAELEGPQPDDRPLSVVWVACAHARLGEHDAAVALLERGVRERDPQLIMLRLLDRPLVVFDALRQDPRVRAIVARLGREPVAPTPSADAKRATPAARETPRALAVLPMVNTSGDPENEHFGDGLTDELIGALSTVPALRVTGRTSVFALKGKGLGVAEVASTLGVQHVLEGTVRRAGQRMKARVQLVAADGAVVWAEGFDRTLEDVFAVQEEIAQAVARALQVRLGSAPLVRRPTDDLVAHDLYLRGRSVMRGGHPGALREAIALWEQAIARDPAFALPHAALAWTYALLPIMSDLPAREFHPKARFHARRALELDDALGEAHLALANVHYAAGLDVPAAGVSIRRALELDPGNAEAHRFYAIWLEGQRHFAEAEAHAQRAVAIDPLMPEGHLVLGWVYMVSGRPAQGLPHIQRSVAMAPAFAFAYEMLVFTYVLLGRLDDALAQARRAVEVGSRRERGLLAYVHAVRGEHAEARTILAALQTPDEAPYAPPCHMAYAYAALGEIDTAIGWVERAFAEMDPHLNGLAIIPAYDPLRGDPRFQALVARLRHAPVP